MLGIRKEFLPQGTRHYIPLEQRTSQSVMREVLSKDSAIVILIGSHTNFATLLMAHPELKRNVERLYIMGGGVRSKNPTGCCPEGSPNTCTPTQCGIRGNLFDGYDTNPWAEFNMFMDPFAAYVVFHAGIPITLVPLDATNTIPITVEFFDHLKQNQSTYEAQYVYKVLELIKDTWFNDNFNKEYFLWDSFASGVAVSSILTSYSTKDNHFCDMEYRNVTVVTSNEPYGVDDGSNPSFDGRAVPRFHLRNGSVHSGHVQTGLQDPFCLTSGKRGKCQDGYTVETPGGIRIQVGTRAKLRENGSLFFFQESFIQSLNDPKHKAIYNFEAQFPCYKEVLYKANQSSNMFSRSVILDMDMSPGDIITLFYLLKLPRHTLDLKAITISATGWSNAATIDLIYDVLHMMGRDDIPVGLGEFFALGQPYLPSGTTGDCKYRQWIPSGEGGFIDSDTLFGLARDLPRSPRRYTAENSIKFGAPRNTNHPERRQQKAQEVIEKVLHQNNKRKVFFLTGGPLTNMATFLASNTSLKSQIKEIFIAGGVVNGSEKASAMGNVHTLPQNKLAEFNFFLDPQAAQNTFKSDVKIFLVPLNALYNEKLTISLLDALNATRRTPEAKFVHRLLLTVHELEEKRSQYSHTAKLMEEVVAAVALAETSNLKNNKRRAQLVVEATGDVHTDGWTRIVDKGGKNVQYVSNLNPQTLALSIARALNSAANSAVLASFTDQMASWTSSC
ncbi:hypothetical protein KP509_26G019400 [Ceratopteris richardii]|nr:hypothetical protein KP509_26G019400 [Ceratopteris richardii]